MRTIGNYLIFSISAALCLCAEAFTVAERGRGPDCEIIISKNADAVHRFAAEELRDHVKRITGVTLPVVVSRGKARKAVVISGGHFKDDGFRLRTDGDTLHIEGGARAGVLYGVYELLERFGGCGWFSPDVDRVPAADRFTVPDGIDIREKPAFEQRDTAWHGVKTDRLFAARLRLNGTRSTGDDPKLGGHTPYQYDKLLGNCHTFDKLVPAKKYFKTNPEYFSEINGVRMADLNNTQGSQLCLTNPDVERLVISNVLARIRANPGIRYFGVSQNDNIDKYCRCAKCRAIDEEEESHAGTVIRFVNRVAEAVEKEYPHVIIETLAYLYSQKPPKITRPRHNVLPCLCTIRCEFSKPIATSRFGENATFRKDIRRWRDISSGLYIWDYTTNYRSYQMAMPNIDVLRENLRFFRDNGATHIYEQGQAHSPYGWFAELKPWLIAKLEWNPDQPLEPLIDTFLKGYYGPAAPHVRKYLDAVRECARGWDETVHPLTIYKNVTGEEYPPGFFERLAPHWDAAWEAAKDDPVYRETVGRSRCTFDYVRARRFMSTPSGARVVCAREATVDRTKRAEIQKIVRERVIPRIERLPAGSRFFSEGREQHRIEMGILRNFISLPEPETVGTTISIEEHVGELSSPEKYGRFTDDPEAENGRAALLNPGYGWTYRIFFGAGVGFEPGSRCRFRVRARVAKRPGSDGTALWAGVYNCSTRKYKADITLKASEMKDGYAWYDIGTLNPSPDDILYVSPGTRKKDGSLSSDGLFIDKFEMLLDDPAVDTRPYEFRLAKRDTDFREPCADFEKNGDWRTEASDAEARFECNATRKLFGAKTGELRYRGTGPSPVVKLIPEKEIKASDKNADSLTVWVRGNHFGHGANRQFDIPSPDLFVSLRLDDGTVKKYKIISTIWLDWHLLSFRLPPEDRNKSIAAFLGFSLEGEMQKESLSLHFDNLAVFRDPRAPITIPPRAKRNLKPLPDADQGINTGSGILPFPTREETILPPAVRDDSLAFSCEEGPLGPDFRVSLGGSRPVSVFAEGGVKTIVTGDGRSVAPVSAKRLSRGTSAGDTEERWLYTAPDAEAVVVYTYRRMGNSMVVDLRAEKGAVGEVSAGDLGDARVHKAFTVPYLAYGPDIPQGVDPRRAPVIAFDSGDGGSALFRYAAFDWYRSNASRVDGAAAKSGRMTQRFFYLKKSDGKHVPLSERIFINISRKFDEVLPFIPNPPSPLKHITGKKLWRAHASSMSRARDRHFWKTLHRYGIREMVVNDHETMWRDGGESYTFRTTFAEGKGGDEAQYAYTRFMCDELGYHYGPYDNFWDYAPVSENFTFDNVAVRNNGTYMTSWMRTYAPKAVTAPWWSERIVPVVQKKMRFNTCYCDCHTAGSPWCRTDYDARVPGAGTFSAAFYAFGELLLVQRRDWEGPIYSEGATRCFYAGLLDGNYADDRGYDFQRQPWLVDFDLLRIHPLGCDFGMGTVSMFYPDNITLAERRYYLPHFNSDAERTEITDRFLAATVAFGHTGLLLAEYCFDPARTFGPAYGPTAFGRFDFETGIPHAWRSYFMIQGVAAHYTQTEAAEIGYVTADGKIENTTTAILSGTVGRQQVFVRYKDGTEVLSNGSRKDRMSVVRGDEKIDLPPCGYLVRSGDGKALSECSDRGGSKADYAVSPDYIYIDGRGRTVTRELAKSDGPAVCRIIADGYEIIPFGGSRCAFRIPGGKATALDMDGKVIGPAEAVIENGWYSVKPVPGAVSYKITRL